MNSFTRILPLNGRHISPFPRNPLSLQHQHSLALRLQYRTKFSKPKIAIKLNAAVPKLGSINDVVLVKRGFARNVLVPMGMGYYVKGKEAELTVTGAKERAAEKKRRMEQRDTRLDLKALELPKETQLIRAHHDGKLYGSVSHEDMLTEFGLQDNPTVEVRILDSEGTVVDRIKSLGDYTVVVGNGKQEVKVIAHVIGSEEVNLN